MFTRIKFVSSSETVYHHLLATTSYKMVLSLLYFFSVSGRVRLTARIYGASSISSKIYIFYWNCKDVRISKKLETGINLRYHAESILHNRYSKSHYHLFSEPNVCLAWLKMELCQASIIFAAR